MKILITSGGTREPIDDVRYVGNSASGRTGALIAQEAVRRFHTVFLMSGEGAAAPESWALETGLLVQERFSSAADLLTRCEALLAAHRVDAIIASAAVADYAPVRTQGKIPSALLELTVRMVPTPKVIDRLVELAPMACMVAFKLESGVDAKHLLASAQRIMERVGAAAVVANDLSWSAQGDLPALLVTREGTVERVTGRRELAVRLVDLLEKWVNAKQEMINR